ncbi:MAG: glycerol kinase [Anaerolineaceae bacterium]|nr:glycerol kinase [Anaerolineae bacterium]MDL1925044.1 glycerol kinase GlpK [Anaerolineae bacterium AMX1]WKZ53461.1 MAG: glycerol kinase GlpK [Anaerolineales bacterium]GIK09929.1 MAG: glycerol kinase [Chloroflexota bacterium]GJQ38968.1 MAG: glycerol kinase [Anaerolineaceae bacterium]
MSKYVAAIDQGTTSTRFIVFDHDGNAVVASQKEHQQIYPKPGWVEHDPLQIWERMLAVMTTALERGRIVPEQIVAVGVTNQRETTVVWDRRTGKPIHNAIVWQDTRTDEICGALAKQGGQDRLRAKTGLPLATYFSGPKIKWILENVSGARKKADNGDLLFGTIDSWLIWNLTGEHVTDVTNASRTLLMNLETLDWDDEILKLLGIPRAMLPRIKSSSEIYGRIAGSGDLPLRGVPVAGDLGDQQAALFGQTCYSAGEAKNTYGTGCFMLMNTGEKPVPSKSGLLTTLGYKIGDQKAVYALEGSIAVTGALVQWLRDNLGLIQKSSDVEALAKSVDDNGGVYFVPAFSGLFAPYWRSDARGVIVGMTRYVNKGHIARAALEATAFQTREVLDAMETDSGVKLTALKVDGGMVFNDLLMQFQSDILSVPVVRPKVAETTALGAAYAAGLAVGFWKDFDELRANWGRDREWKPQMDSAKRDKLYSEWKKAVTRTFDWL